MRCAPRGIATKQIDRCVRRSAVRLRGEMRAPRPTCARRRDGGSTTCPLSTVRSHDATCLSPRSCRVLRGAPRRVHAARDARPTCVALLVHCHEADRSMRSAKRRQAPRGGASITTYSCAQTRYVHTTRHVVDHVMPLSKSGSRGAMCCSPRSCRALRGAPRRVHAARDPRPTRVALLAASPRMQIELRCAAKRRQALRGGGRAPRPACSRTRDTWSTT